VKAPKAITVQAYTDSGVLHIEKHVRAQMAAAVKRWPNLPVEITIAPFEQTRRARANRYYWGVVLKMMAVEMQQSADDIHEIEKMRHNSKLVFDPASGEEVKVAQSTAKLKVQEFSDYLERVMLDGSEYLGIVFPEPTPSEDWRATAEAGT